MNKNRFHIDLSRSILNLFENTVDGKVTFYLCSEDGLHVEPTSFKVSWTESEAKELNEKFVKLTAILKKLGKRHEDLTDEAKRETLLTKEEKEIYNIFIPPYENCPVDLNLVEELFDRVNGCDDLTEEENKILEQYGAWQEGEALKRLPFLRTDPHSFILRGRRFEKLASINAPEIVLNEEARCLAEEMVLYHFFEYDPENELDKILSGETKLN